MVIALAVLILLIVLTGTVQTYMIRDVLRTLVHLRELERTTEYTVRRHH